MSPFLVYTPETAPTKSKAALEEATQAWGFTPRLHGILAESPITLSAYNTLFDLVGQSSLTPQEQQVVYLAVSVFHECEYCTMGHTYLATQTNIPPADIDALRESKTLNNNRLNTLRNFALTVVEQRAVVTEKSVDNFLAAGFTKENVLEIITIIATKTISNYANRIAQTPKESFMSEPGLKWVAPSNR